jgi:hypothetical protein
VNAQFRQSQPPQSEFWVDVRDYGIKGGNNAETANWQSLYDEQPPGGGYMHPLGLRSIIDAPIRGWGKQEIFVTCIAAARIPMCAPASTIADPRALRHSNSTTALV